MPRFLIADRGVQRRDGRDDPGLARIGAEIHVLHPRGLEREIRVIADQEKLASIGLTLTDVAEQIDEIMNLFFPQQATGRAEAS